MTLDNKNLIFDIDNGFNTFDLSAKQFDTNSARSFTFQLIHNNSPFDLTGIVVNIGGIKADGKKIYNDVNIVDATNGIVELDLTSQMLAVDGVLKLEFVFIKGDVRLSSYPFEIKIVPSVTNFSVIESSDEFHVLTNAIDKVQNLNNETQNAINNMKNQVNNAITDVKANQIGGTNLLSGTQFFDYGWEGGHGTSTIINKTNLFQGCAVQEQWFNWNYFAQVMCYEIGEIYTISCYAKTDKVGAKIYFSLTDNMTAWGMQELTTDWKRYVFSFTPTEGKGTLRIESSCDNWDNNKVYISKIKLEKGSMATDWCPNPTDYEQQIGGSNLFLNTGLDNNIEVIEKTDNFNFTISSEKSGVQAIYNNKFLFFDNSDPFGDAYATLFKTEDYCLIPNSMYTVSFIYKCQYTGDTPSTSSYIRLVLSDDTTSWLQINDIDFKNSGVDWKVSKFTFEVPSNIKRVELRLGFVTNKYGWFAVNGIKLEKGLTATNWCPNYSDWRKQIGGTNLIVNTSFTGAKSNAISIPYWSMLPNLRVYSQFGDTNYNDPNTIYLAPLDGNGNTSSDRGYLYSELPVNLEVNSTYTVSFKIRDEDNSKGHLIKMEYFDEKWNNVGIETLHEGKHSGGDYLRFSKTFVTPIGYAHSRFTIVHNGCANTSENGGYLLNIGDIKLEKGYVPTAWSLAPNDISNLINTNTQQIASNSSSINDLYNWVDKNIKMVYISGATSLTLNPNCAYYLDGQHVADITHIDHSAIPTGGKVYFYVASGDSLAHIVFRRSGLCNQDARVWLPKGQDFWITGNDSGDTIFTLMKIGDAMRFLS